ncbi:MAG: phosphate starvation-inducible protein PhoH [Candidatus Omnitrophica bacterium CG11_big_fil_rev_8_21_14_0_20_45_26]|uniref:PhoH-like protein n=1 Tax=Candidatus Abzuiibacterium crystallinum TaxID=1974748 RepID=A0A2H0LMT8_9BACT|nr:MAG: phosphate starvation-inducible protein PhoH [Candidatus Omnitrophica bacterium CG11_big_fil_rev_8_21_14_0_20_45_26]PIW65223.1 MAG: phosphate starvation-inducible protein PhoH [Candidatus Omnitrophica bacterium CG12_big_fil_rev_8_21_14_0_65_45_16]
MKKTLKLHSDDEAIALYGNLDEKLRFAETHFRVHISAKNHELTIEGQKPNVAKAIDYFKDMLRQIRSDGSQLTVAVPRTSPEHYAGRSKSAQFFHKGKVVKPKSINQEEYLDAVNHYDVVIAIGPAGTGKTYLAMALAINALKRKQIERIILTRPAVEAGESLGFLPGDLSAKINPYLRPLYDALYDMMDFDEAARHIQRGTIEVAPLAYMRGRTLNDAIVILDEAQNCTYEQLKMFLTRLGVSSKMIVTGDVTQIDLPNGKRSGLLEAQGILNTIEGLKFIYFNEKDVVRHPLVQAIIKAYDQHEKNQ